MIRTRKSPATGVCRWLANSPNGNRQIRITTDRGVSHDYEVVEAPGGFDLFRLTDGEVAKYHITCIRATVWMCDCPAARNGQATCCKHVQALKAAMNALPF